MEIIGIELHEVEAITRKVGAVDYDDNLSADMREIGRGRTTGGELGPKVRGRFVPVRGGRERDGSPRPGVRTACSGRTIHGVTWDAHRDIMRALFEAYPTAVIRTGLATYRGLEGFERDHGATYYHNAGSQMSPAYIGDL